MAEYPKIIIDETKNAPIDVARDFSTEHYYDFMHHTHKMSDIVNDVEEETYDDTEIKSSIEELKTAVEGKVDAVEGKSLVDDAEIERLAGLVNYDDTQIRADFDKAMEDQFNMIMGITDEDSTTVDEAYDTLKEVSKYINEDGAAATKLLNKVADIEEAVNNKVDAVEGKSLVDDIEIERLSGVSNYDDTQVKQLIEKLSERVVDIEAKDKFKIANIPAGTLVKIREDEIRVMCPADTKWVKQTVGTTGNANMYYMSFKAYAPEGAVSFKEGDRGVIVDEMFTFDSKFAGKDEHGNYSICWLALASYNETTDTWTYFGKNSSTKKYIGWDYVVEWYDDNGDIIATDSIRINLSNEDCHLINEPYYATKIMEELSGLNNYDDTDIKKSIEEIVQYDKVIAREDLVSDHYIDRRGEPYLNEEYNCFFANGVPVTVTEDPDNADGVIIKWGVVGELKIADASTLYVYGGADGYVTPKYIPHTKVTVNSGYVRCLYAGGCANCVVDNAEVIVNGGTVKNIMGGGRASDRRDPLNRSAVVYNSKVTMNGGNCNMLVGGSVGYGITEKVSITINDGAVAGYLIAGGSNGAVEYAEININGGITKLFQSTNRGYMTDVEFNMTGGSVTNVYCGGEPVSDVDGTINSFKCNITGGIIDTMAVGTDGSTAAATGVEYVEVPMSLDKISGIIAEGVVINISDELKNKLQ